MRALAWGDDGVALIGELPWSPPAAPVPAAWYVEPTKPIDRAGLAQLVAALRAQRIPGLSLRGQAIAPWLAELRDLPALRALILDDTGASAGDLAAMQLPAELERLGLARTGATDDAVAAIAARHAQLTAIDLEDTAAGDGAAAALARVPTLRAVSLAGTALTDAGAARLGALRGLQVVDLARTRAGARAVAALRELPLRALFLDGTAVGRELSTLAVLAPALRRLDVSRLRAYRPTDADLAWLARARELIELGASGSALTDRVAAPVAELPHLERIRLAGTGIGQATIAALAARATRAGQTDLIEVDLAATPVSDALATQLLSAPRLRVIRLDATPITDAALAAADVSLALAELYVSDTQITAAGLAILAKLPHLDALGVARTAIGAAGFAAITRLRELRTLVLSGVDAPRDALAGLASLSTLERLYLDGTQADDATLTAIAGLRALRVLHLEGTGASDAALPALRRLQQLEELTVGESAMSTAVADLAAWPRLRTLSLTGLEIGDPELAVLAQSAALAALDLSRTEVRDPAPLGALPRLRELGLAQLRHGPARRASVAALRARGVAVVE
jgi:hypothetical protein